MHLVTDPFSRRTVGTDHPKVSVIILNLDQPDMTAQAVQAIRATTEASQVEVIVVDNGSKQEEFSRLCDMSLEATLIRLSQNIFFGEGNNLGVDHAHGEVLVFVNNDVVVQDGWLPPLLASLEDPYVGAAGSVFIDDKKRVLEAGSRINRRGRAVPQGRGGQVGELGTKPIEVSFVSAACVAIRRETFFAVGGFDFVYSPAYFEDADLCRRLAEQSLATVVCPRSLAEHRENQTARRLFRRHELAILKVSNRMVFLANRAARTGALAQPDAINHAMKGPPRGETPVAIYLPDGADLTASTLLGLSVCAALHRMGVPNALVVPERCSRLKLAQLCSVFKVAGPISTIRAEGEVDHSEVVVRIARQNRSDRVGVQLSKPADSTRGDALFDRLVHPDVPSQPWSFPALNSSLDLDGSDVLLAPISAFPKSLIRTLRTLAAIPAVIALGRLQSKQSTINLSRPGTSIPSRARFAGAAAIFGLSAIPTLSSPFIGGDGLGSLSAQKHNSLVSNLVITDGGTTRQSATGVSWIARALLRIAGFHAVVPYKEAQVAHAVRDIAEGLAQDANKLREMDIPSSR